MMRILIRLIRIYTPFICTLMVLLNGVLFMYEKQTLFFMNLLSSTTGYSIAVVLYMFATSMRMCIWYKLNLLCLLLVQICGLMYNCYEMDYSLYLWIVVLLSALGIMFFLIFRIFYNVTRLFGCNRRHL